MVVVVLDRASNPDNPQNVPELSSLHLWVVSALTRLSKDDRLGLQCKGPGCLWHCCMNANGLKNLPLTFSRWGQRRRLQSQKSLVLVSKEGFQHDGAGEVQQGSQEALGPRCRRRKS